MKTENEIIDILYKQYQNQGYVTEQTIFDLCDDNSLSFLATDRICNQLINKGIYISDGVKKLSDDHVIEDIKDYSQIDYNQVYDYYMLNCPQMIKVIEHIKSVIPPQKGENKELIIQIRSGNRFARSQIIDKNLRIALRVAMNYSEKTDIPLEDIFGVACEGLIAAVDSFDPYSNTYFASYCSFWIMQKIERYIIDSLYPIRIPVHSYSIYVKVKEIIESSSTYNEKTIIKRIVDEVFLDGESAREWYRIVYSLDYYDVDEAVDMELDLYDPFEDYNDAIHRSILKSHIDDIINTLSPQTQDVLALRYGLIDNNVYTLEEIGAKFKVTRERIRQIEKSALRKIKNSVKSTTLYSEYFDYYEE